MFAILIVTFFLGIVSGLRAFTPIAALLITRGGIVGILCAIAAFAELIGDKLPFIPSRTSLPALSLRLFSGAFVGSSFSGRHGASPIFGGILGVIGSLIGTYGGRAVRVAAIAKIGNFPSAILEDAIAVGLAAFIVTRF
ncbi:hypothetical protein [Calothrix sp. PCC 6303]|uniref:hypothetical protein n=1 Tax=Calothrix sp. PCC 6303 TaxID=1170562 RepID=UPI0002A05835|nr:hypothetical protein [Calothrix sp. PCC 6303]AFZ04548.1 hypothetical protein Cal6303_5675 [Calothrix sp. PCC 6303]